MKIFKKIFINFFFQIIFILQLNLYSIKSATTENEMDRICSLGEFDKVEHKDGYRTIQHFADDYNIKISDIHPFYGRKKIIFHSFY